MRRCCRPCLDRRPCRSPAGPAGPRKSHPRSRSRPSARRGRGRQGDRRCRPTGGRVQPAVGKRVPPTPADPVEPVAGSPVAPTPLPKPPSGTSGSSRRPQAKAEHPRSTVANMRRGIARSPLLRGRLKWGPRPACVEWTTEIRSYIAIPMGETRRKTLRPEAEAYPDAGVRERTAMEGASAHLSRN